MVSTITPSASLHIPVFAAPMLWPCCWMLPQQKWEFRCIYANFRCAQQWCTKAHEIQEKTPKIFPYNLASYISPCPQRDCSIYPQDCSILQQLFPILFTRTTSRCTYRHSENPKGPPVTLVNDTEVLPTLLSSEPDALFHLSWLPKEWCSLGLG